MKSIMVMKARLDITDTGESDMTADQWDKVVGWVCVIVGVVYFYLLWGM